MWIKWNGVVEVASEWKEIVGLPNQLATNKSVGCHRPLAQHVLQVTVHGRHLGPCLQIAVNYRDSRSVEWICAPRCDMTAEACSAVGDLAANPF
jgi:hypothetical protein